MLNVPSYIHKSTLMKQAERKLDGEKLEDFIVRNINKSDQVETARLLGLGKSTLAFWMIKLGIKVQKVALLPGQRVYISYPGTVSDTPYPTTLNTDKDGNYL